MAPRKSTLAKVALQNLNDIHDMAEENRRLDGNREAHKTLAFSSTVRTAAHSIKTIMAYDSSMLPVWLIRDWAYLKTIGWHCEAAAPRTEL